MDGETLRQCEGYCGGMVKVKNTRTVRGGERFCKDCYDKAKED